MQNFRHFSMAAMAITVFFSPTAANSMRQTMAADSDGPVVVYRFFNRTSSTITPHIGRAEFEGLIVKPYSTLIYRVRFNYPQSKPRIDAVISPNGRPIHGFAYIPIVRNHCAVAIDYVNGQCVVSDPR